MIFWRKILFLFFLSWINNFLFAQDTTFYLSGKVKDEQTNTAIGSAIIKICGSYRATCTDSNGFFSINAKKSGEVLEINAIGYLPYYISTPFLITPDYVFKLKKLNLVFDEKASFSERVYYGTQWRFKDFIFFNNKIIAIATHSQSSRDAVLSIKLSGEIETVNFVADRLTGLVITYDGLVVVLGERSAFLLFNLKPDLVLETWDINNFEKKYFNNPFSDSSGKYFRYQSGYDFYLSTDSKLMVRRSYTSYHVQMKKNNRLALFKNFSDDKFISTPGTWKSAKEIQGARRELFSNGNIFFHDVPWVIIQDYNQLIFIDSENMKLEVFDSKGNLVNNVRYKTGLIGEISHKLLYDKKTRKFYCCVLNKVHGSSTGDLVTNIFEMNILTGATTKKAEFPSDVYGSMKVSNNMIYYIVERGGEIGLYKFTLE